MHHRQESALRDETGRDVERRRRLHDKAAAEGSRQDERRPVVKLRDDLRARLPPLAEGHPALGHDAPEVGSRAEALQHAAEGRGVERGFVRAERPDRRRQDLLSLERPPAEARLVRPETRKHEKPAAAVDELRQKRHRLVGHLPDVGEDDGREVREIRPRLGARHVNQYRLDQVVRRLRAGAQRGQLRPQRGLQIERGGTAPRNAAALPVDQQQRRVHGVVYRLMAPLGEEVGDQAVLFIGQEGPQDAGGIHKPARGQGAAREGDHGVPAPIAEQRVTRQNGHAVGGGPAGHKGVGADRQLPSRKPARLSSSP